MANLMTPIHLAMLGDDGVTDEIVVEDVLRELPGRRLSGRARWRNQAVFAKLLLDRSRAPRHLARERQGASALAAHGVPAPRLLRDGISAGPVPELEGAPILLFEWLDGPTLEQVLAAHTQPEEARPQLEDAIRLLARHHRAGLVHRDLHFDNLLVTPRGLVSLDAGAVEEVGTPLPRRHAARQLAVFFTQADPRFDACFRDLLDAWVEAMQLAEPPARAERLWRLTARRRRMRYRRLEAKVMGDSRWTRRVARDTVLARGLDGELSRALLDWLARADLGSERALPPELAGRRVRWHTCRATPLADDVAARRWRSSHRLAVFGVAVAPLVAYVRRGRRAACIEIDPGDGDADAGSPDSSERADAAARLLVRLHQLDLAHGALDAPAIVFGAADARIADPERLCETAPPAVGRPRHLTPDMTSYAEVLPGVVPALARMGYGPRPARG